MVQEGSHVVNNVNEQAKYTAGQSVCAHLYSHGAWRICIPAVVVERLKNGLWRLEDKSGTRIDLPPDRVYPSQEAFEASINALAVSVNTQSGRTTEFK